MSQQPKQPAEPNQGSHAMQTMSEELGAHAPPAEAQQQQITTILRELDVRDSNSILFFGAKAQEQLTSISEDMLEGMRSKDSGAAGHALNEMVSVLRGFEIDALDPNKKPGLFGRLLGRPKPLTRVLQRYETVRDQIDGISDTLEQHETILLTDITALDRLYQATLEYFHNLEMYIKAGEEKLKQLDNEMIPALERAAADAQSALKAQELRDVRSARDNLERRLHDLQLTRQVTMQSLPSIRLVQENDKGLVNKIRSTMVNTVPLWRQQLAQAITIYRSGEAAKTVKAATDLTNELLMANAENLKQANAEIRRQVERGVFDIATVKKANDTLIATIEEGLQIADEGRRRRQEAAAQLESCEAALRKTLAAARGRDTTNTPR